jgi:membrane protein implicated in regulation of membrane protease activity
MDIASKYAGHFVLLLGGVVILAAVTVVLVMLAQVLMVMMITLAVCSVAVAAAVGKLRYSKIDKQIGDQRERAAKRGRGRR